MNPKPIPEIKSSDSIRALDKLDITWRQVRKKIKVTIQHKKYEI